MATQRIVGTMYCLFYIGFCNGDSIYFGKLNKMKWLDPCFLDDFIWAKGQDYLLAFLLSMARCVPTCLCVTRVINTWEEMHHWGFHLRHDAGSLDTAAFRLVPVVRGVGAG